MHRLKVFIRKSEKGFTLVELMWAASFMFIVLAASYLVYETGLRSSSVTTDMSVAQEEARRAERLITRYLRQARSLKSDTVTDYRLGFYAQLNASATVTQYLLVEIVNETDLRLTVNGAARGTFRWVRNAQVSPAVPLFTYYDRNGAEVADPARRASDSRSIRVTIVADPALNRQPAAYRLSTLVKLRNFVF